MTVVVGRVSRPYWNAIPAEERAAILEAIPPEHRLHIKPGHHAKPGTADVELRTEDNRTVRSSRGYVTAQRCWAVLPRTVVTTDAGGWVRSIEDEPA